MRSHRVWALAALAASIAVPVVAEDVTIVYNLTENGQGTRHAVRERREDAHVEPGHRHDHRVRLGTPGRDRPQEEGVLGDDPRRDGRADGPDEREDGRAAEEDAGADEEPA